MLVIKERIAPGEQRAIGLCLRQAEHHLDRLDAVPTKAPALDDSFLAQLRQRAHGAGASDLELAEPRVAMEVLREVVDPDEIDSIDAHALQAVLDRALRAVSRIVVDDLVLAAMLEHAGLLA